MFRRKSIQRVFLYIFLLLFLILLLFPFYWMFITSFKTDAELYDVSSIPFTITKGITLKNYNVLLANTNFLRWFSNSLVISITVTVTTLIISFLAAYSLTRLDFPGSKIVAITVFVTYLVPPTLLFIPLFRVVVGLRLTDTIWSLALTHLTFTLPFATWLLIGYLKEVPKELEECAMIDGATRLQALTRIVLPVILPGITAVALFTYSLSWSEFLYGMSFVSSSVNKPLSVGVVQELVFGDVFFWGSLMGGALLASVPVVVIYSFFTDYFVAGLTKGAVKY